MKDLGFDWEDFNKAKSFMELNKLTFKTEEQLARRSILWFELLIDGETVKKIIGDEKAIPHYYFDERENDYFFDESEKNLPYEINYEGKKLYLLEVCICGHAGCGSIQAELEKSVDFVDLKVFYPSGGYKTPEEIKFSFARENYESVIDEIKKLAKGYKEKSENNNS